MLLTCLGVETGEQTRQSHPRRTRSTSGNKWVSHTVCPCPPLASSSFLSPPRGTASLPAPLSGAVAEAGATAERGAAASPCRPAWTSCGQRDGAVRAAQPSPGAASRSRSAAHGAQHGAAVRSRGAAVPATPEGTRRPLCGGLGGCPSRAHCAAEPPSGLRVYRLVLLLREPPSPESEAPGEQLLLLLPGGIPRGPSRSQAGGRAGARGSTYSLSHDRVSVC